MAAAAGDPETTCIRVAVQLLGGPAAATAPVRRRHCGRSRLMTAAALRPQQDSEASSCCPFAPVESLVAKVGIGVAETSIGVVT